MDFGILHTYTTILFVFIFVKEDFWDQNIHQFKNFFAARAPSKEHDNNDMDGAFCNPK